MGISSTKVGVDVKALSVPNGGIHETGHPQSDDASDDDDTPTQADIDASRDRAQALSNVTKQQEDQGTGCANLNRT